MAVVIAVALVIVRPKAKRQVPVEKGRLVEVFPARAEDVQMVVESFGTVEPRESLKLVAQVRGPIVDISPTPKEGSFIKKGTRLIQIDPRTFTRGSPATQRSDQTIRCGTQASETGSGQPSITGKNCQIRCEPGQK